MTETRTDTYTIHLPYFEGPFDLLLFFIERDELDINDIPIAKITDDFLGYLRQMEDKNIDLASEFILVAASLMRIKAKMLIPRKPVDEEGNEIDPREELVQRLMEYKRYKEVLDEIRELEKSRALKFHRGNVKRELQQIATRALVNAELESLSLYKLLKTFQQLTEKLEDRERRMDHRVYKFEYSVEGQQKFIMKTLRKYKKADFDLLFSDCTTKLHAIFNFLALLELLHLQKIQITQGEGLNNFWIEV